MRQVTFILGPTASGKTRLAIEMAKANRGVIINCDSLQVYSRLKTLTAFPSNEELEQALHKLFGILEPEQRMNAVQWARLAALEIEKAFQEGMMPIVTGGTGLYAKVLISGISPMPEISAENRTKAMKLALEDFDKLCEIVYEDDPMLRERLSKDKHHQLIRAYEVMLETGRSIRVFQEQPRITFVPDIVPSIHKIEVPRAELYQRIERRFDKMLELGAIDEVKELLAELPDLSAPIYNAIGAREIARYLAGDLSFEEMHNTAILNSRHYAKRQITWLRTQLPY